MTNQGTTLQPQAVKKGGDCFRPHPRVQLRSLVTIKSDFWIVSDVGRRLMPEEQRYVPVC